MLVRPPFDQGMIWSTCRTQVGFDEGLSPHSTHLNLSRLSTWNRTPREIPRLSLPLSWMAVESCSATRGAAPTVGVSEARMSKSELARSTKAVNAFFHV